MHELLRRHIASYDQLELLLLLRAERARWCSEPWLEDKRPGMLDALQHLVEQRLVVERGGTGERLYQYNPPDEQIARAIDHLATVYRNQPHEVMRVMTANAVERVRSQAARTFGEVLGKKHES